MIRLMVGEMAGIGIGVRVERKDRRRVLNKILLIGNLGSCPARQGASEGTSPATGLPP